MKLPFSVLRSPGSKGWFLPYAEAFVRDQQPATIIEAFAGSAILGLTLLDHGYGQRLVLAEKDPELYQFWVVALSDPKFAQRVADWTLRFLAMQPEERYDFAVKSALRMQKSDPAFSVLLRSRLEFNGILRKGTALSIHRPTRNWWPPTLAASLRFLYTARKKIEVLPDAFEALRLTNRPDSYGFIDPPYTFGKKAPGHKLYRYPLSYNEHMELVRLLADWRGAWQMTSEFCPEMLRRLREVKFDPPIEQCLKPMHTANGRLRMELVISRKSIIRSVEECQVDRDAENICHATHD